VHASQATYNLLYILCSPWLSHPKINSVDNALEQHFLTVGTLQSFEVHQSTCFEYGIKFERSSIHNCSIPDHIVFSSSSDHFTLCLLSCEATFLNLLLHCPLIFLWRLDYQLLHSHFCLSLCVHVAQCISACGILWHLLPASYTVQQMEYELLSAASVWCGSCHLYLISLVGLHAEWPWCLILACSFMYSQ
jgi:hypothetical protein